MKNSWAILDSDQSAAASPPAQVGQPVWSSTTRKSLPSFIPKRIQATITNPKFVVLLRDPISRLFSHWWHWHVLKAEKRSFAEIVEEGLSGKENEILNRSDFESIYPASVTASGPNIGYSSLESYVSTSAHRPQIERYYQIFGEESFLILFLEDLACDPEATVSKVCSFLNVSAPEGLSPSEGRKNSASSPLSARLSQLSRKVPLASPVRRVFGKPAKLLIDLSKSGAGYNTQHKKLLAPHHADLQSFYEDDVCWIRAQSGRDLAKWIADPQS